MNVLVQIMIEAGKRAQHGVRRPLVALSAGNSPSPGDLDPGLPVRDGEHRDALRDVADVFADSPLGRGVQALVTSSKMSSFGRWTSAPAMAMRRR